MNVVEVRARLAAGMPPGDLSGLPSRVARAVTIARELGAPVLPALAAAQAADDDARDRGRALRVATAQTRTVVAGLSLLPVVLVPGLGRILGLDLLGFYSTEAGRPVAIVAGGLLAVGHGIVRLLVRRAASDPDDTDEVADLLAAAVTSGVAVPTALRAAGRHLPGHVDVLSRMALALELDRTLAVPDPHGRILATLRSATTWGAPVAPALRHLADDLRSARHHRALEAVERLPALLTFPTALFLLPACVLLIGAPLVADGLTAVGAGLTKEETVMHDHDRAPADVAATPGEEGSLVTEYGLIAVLGATIAGIAIKWASGGAIFELLGALLAKVRVLVGA